MKSIRQYLRVIVAFLNEESHFLFVVLTFTLSYVLALFALIFIEILFFEHMVIAGGVISSLFWR